MIVGGGLSGLAAAILLGRAGWRVTVLERDRRPAVDTPDEAFALWQRAGVAQFRHSHTFLARLTVLMRERFPEVLNLLRTHGALELPLTVNLPPGLDLGPRERGDGELVLLGCRRAAFEWALERVARFEPNVEIREGVLVEGLAVHPARRDGDGAKDASAQRRVRGVRVRLLPSDGRNVARGGIPWSTAPERSVDDPVPAGRRSIVAADVVIDASGRRSRAAEWLPAVGARAPREKSVPTGIFYFTRFYRLTGERPPGATAGLVAGDVGWLKLATFPGDSGTFSITVGSDIADRPLRALSEPDVFEALLATFPRVAVWRRPGVSEPIDGPDTPVLVMGGLSNRMRSFVFNGEPLLESFFSIGDAAHHTNPIYGRGATCALLSAVALADALAAHPSGDAAAVRALDRAVKREIEPFWVAAAAGDRVARARATASESAASAGLLPSLWALLTAPDRVVGQLLAQALTVYFEHGIVPASRQDGQVFRAVMRAMNMLDDPRRGLLTPTMIASVLPVIARSLAARGERHRFPGPSHDEAIALIARVQRERAKAAQAPSRPSAARAPRPRRKAPARPTTGRTKLRA